MANDTYSAYRQAILSRTRELRDSRKLTQKEVAEALNITLDQYRRYETDSPIAIHLIEPFIRLTRSNVEYLVTGKGKNRRPSEK